MLDDLDGVDWGHLTHAYALTTRQGLPFSKQTVHLILGRAAREDLADTG